MQGGDELDRTVSCYVFVLAALCDFLSVDHHFFLFIFLKNKVKLENIILSCLFFCTSVQVKLTVFVAIGI